MSGMSGPEQVSRIADAKARALSAKQKLVAVAAASFVALVGLAWASHPGSSSSSSSASLDQGSGDQAGSFGEESDDFGGFDSFDSIAPSGGSQPQAQTHVS
jgi:hypothetical protein